MSLKSLVKKIAAHASLHKLREQQAIRRRPKKARRPEGRFTRLNQFRMKFNLWEPSQLEK